MILILPNQQAIDKFKHPSRMRTHPGQIYQLLCVKKKKNKIK